MIKRLMCWLMGHEPPKAYGYVVVVRKETVDGKDVIYYVCTRCGREFVVNR